MQSFRALNSSFKISSSGTRTISTTITRFSSMDKSHATGASKVPGKVQEKVPKDVEDSLPDSVSSCLPACVYVGLLTVELDPPYRPECRPIHQQDSRKGRRRGVDPT